MRTMARRFLLPAALAAAAALATAAAGQDAAEDPVETLRRQQQRLDELNFSVREAELVQRLCSLRPASSECAPPPTASAPAQAGPQTPAPLPAESYEVREIYGSNRRMTAVLSSPRRPRITVRQGSSLSGSLRVASIQNNAVVLVEGDRQHVLLLGN